ncbi:hypothetical protein CFN79_14980 [Chromobacterium vaccinii]|nr:hypothetical protein CFN79_14980 [Chromobacterium vaccinii]
MENLTELWSVTWIPGYGSLNLETVGDLIEKNNASYRKRDPLRLGAAGGVTIFIGEKKEAQLIANKLQEILHADAAKRIAEEKNRG